MNPVINVEGLNRRYGKIQALDNVSLRIGEGDIHGLFGPNGAGKSTLIRVLSGITQPDSGLASIKDLDVVGEPTRAREMCTTVVEIPMLYGNMRLYDLLMFFCSMNGMNRKEAEDSMMEAVHITSIGDIMDKRFSRMSLGQQHRVEVARAIATAKDIMLMDEPFIGIDIDSKKRLKDHFRRWVKEKKGRAIIFTSHNLLENEGLVNRVSFIFRGRLIDTGSIDEIKSRYLVAGYTLDVDDTSKAVSTLSGLQGVRIEKVEGKRIWLLLEDDGLLLEVNRSLAGSGVCINQLQRSGSMEDVFTKLLEVNG